MPLNISLCVKRVLHAASVAPPPRVSPSAGTRRNAGTSCASANRDSSCGTPAVLPLRLEPIPERRRVQQAVDVAWLQQPLFPLGGQGPRGSPAVAREACEVYGLRIAPVLHV